MAEGSRWVVERLLVDLTDAIDIMLLKFCKLLLD